MPVIGAYFLHKAERHQLRRGDAILQIPQEIFRVKVVNFIQVPENYVKLFKGFGRYAMLMLFQMRLIFISLQ